MTFLDSDVLIEVERATPKARAWILSDHSLAAAVPAAVALELVVGARNQQEIARSQKFLQSFDVVPFHEGDFETAFSLVVQYRLTTGLSLPYFLIAAQALNRSATLYTFNLRHFSTITNLDARAPYDR